LNIQVLSQQKAPRRLALLKGKHFTHIVCCPCSAQAAAVGWKAGEQRSQQLLQLVNDT
jgi:hypothetical protein